MTRSYFPRTLALLIAVPLAGVGQAAPSAQIWSVIAFDAKGDGRDPTLPDAAQLSYRYDKQEDVLWFRVSLFGKPNAEAFGVNIVFDTGEADAAKMNWWGANKDFKFDKLVTAWVTKADGGYRGTIGVGDAAGAKAKNFNNLRQDNLKVRVGGDSIIIGVKRTDLTDKMKMNLIAAVGSNEQWNDDIPKRRFATVDLSAARPTRGIRELDLSRNNFRFSPGYKTLSDDRPPTIVKRGRGRATLILIPGAYSGNEVFERFISRNESRYTFYVVTPPGLNGTAARALPAETISYGELPWTRRLTRDAADLIRREKLDKPVIVAHGFPGSLVAAGLAMHNPDLLGGVIDVAVMPVAPFPSFKPSSFGKPASPDERVESVNESWAQKWFKFVTPETWESNNYQASMYTNDSDRAERVRRQVESAPLQVKIRYLSEYMAADQSSQLASLTVPLLALVPGFNEQLLADPATSYYKLTFQDSWEPFSKNPRVRRTIIPDARALILDDQPKLADEAIAAFVDQLNDPRVGDSR